jgi:integrase
MYLSTIGRIATNITNTNSLSEKEGYIMLYLPLLRKLQEPWNKGKLIGQKPPLKLREIWSIRIQLQLENRIKDVALFNLAIDSKLRSCDLVTLKVRDITNGNRILPRAMILQQKTKKPVQFEITGHTRNSLSKWIALHNLSLNNYLFSSRLHSSDHISTRQYSRIVHKWVDMIGLDTRLYGTHTMRRTKVTLIYHQPRTCVRYNYC